MRSILVLRGGALGDFIVTLPALALLRQRWPEARIELVGNVRAAELARTRGLVDAVHSQHEARWGALYGTDPLTGPLLTWLRAFELVISYWPDPDGELTRHFPVRADQMFLTATALPERMPAAAHYCAPLQSLGLEPANLWYRLLTHETVASAGDKREEPLHSRPDPAGMIAIHPGSGSTKKNWPRERWLELMTSLSAPLLLVLGEAELESWDPLPTELAAYPRLEVAANLSLEALVTRLSHCALFLGHDSGVSHLAAACGTPCLLLFGPTSPPMWAPPALHVRRLQHGSELAAISVADVVSVLRDQFPTLVSSAR